MTAAASRLRGTISMRLLILSLFLFPATAFCQSPEAPSAPQGLEKFKPTKAPEIKGLLLQKGDRVAICGDSITEQKMYSRIIEDYLTMCVPDLEATVRQYGWSGERAPGFLARMTNDCLRFKPTVATTCYGMNDHEYRPYEDRIGQTYREQSTAIVKAFKANGVRVVLGSPGCVGKMPSWVKTATGTVEDLNLNLCTLRNIDLEIAQAEGTRFADVFWPMLTAGLAARERYGTNFAISGPDGVHPTWAGQTVMAYAFLRAMGLSGEIGSLTLDLAANKGTVSAGHELVSANAPEFVIKSAHYPLCACEPPGQTAANYPDCDKDNSTKDTSIRAGLSLIPFNKELNRFTVIARNGLAANYKVTWGSETKKFTAN